MDNNRKIKATDFYDVGSMKLPAQYSLYRAARWIAFGEKPIEQEYANILYPSEFSDDQEKEIFFSAARALHACLRDGSIKSFCPLWFDGGSGHYFDDATEETIAKELWGYKVNWIDGKLHYDDFETGVDITYCGIRVSAQDLMNKFPEKYKKIDAVENTGHTSNVQNIAAKAGRKPAYDWLTFTYEIIRIANGPDGLPDSQAELERVMAEWCSQNWEKEPGETSLKDHIRPIYRHLGKDGN